MRAVVFAIILAACAPAPPPEPAPPPSPEAMSQELLDALTPVVSAEVGQPVALAASQVRVMNEWGYVVAQPTQPDGAAIDWSTTALAGRAAEGVLDSNGQAHALLRNENGAWRVLEHAIGPTDVVWIGWSAEYGVPEALFN